MQANEFELEYMRSFLESYEAMSSIPEDYFDVHTAEELGISESVRAYMSRERHVHERRMMQKNDPERYAELLKKRSGGKRQPGERRIYKFIWNDGRRI